MFSSIWETILSLIEELPFDLSIIHAYPTILALFSKTNFEHSKLDFPVVITSSIIRTFWFFFFCKISSQFKFTIYSLGENTLFIE